MPFGTGLRKRLVHDLGGSGIGAGVGGSVGRAYLGDGGSGVGAGVSGCKKDPCDLGEKFAPVVNLESLRSPRREEEQAEAV